ncbi:hypothetical protein ACFPL7_03275 [Dongia soli]|uniref:Uncharacterized protein n=1 Tax=Dongia soli TaxID=600628 RepID=A0ABU5EGY6_9PROT|nr:hypothetical protein [Dongia soli]MDY0884688.1 hypothetical protein [Dongia soli]
MLKILQRLMLGIEPPMLPNNRARGQCIVTAILLHDYTAPRY